MRLERDTAAGPAGHSAFVGAKPAADRAPALADRGENRFADAAADAELAARLAAGDESALAALYDAHAPLLYTLALRILTTPQDAEEAVLDAFMQAWRESPRFDPSRGTLRAWLVLITRTRAIDRLRSRGRRDRTLERARELAEPLDGFAATESPTAIPAASTPIADPVQEVTRREQDARVRAALELLPPVVRQAIDLAFFEGLSHSEIAERLGWPLGTVKTRVRSGLIKLREALQPLRDDVA